VKVRRASFIALVAGACWLATGTLAQQPNRLPTIGILLPDKSEPSNCDARVAGFPMACMRDGLRALGYVEGRNVAFEYRFAGDDYRRLPALATELVALRPDVIFTASTGGAEAAAKATSTIPIVVGNAGEPTLIRLAGNLARPMGNVTGFTAGSFGFELIEKSLQLLKELAPRTSRIAVIYNPDNKIYTGSLDMLAPAARQLDITLVNIEARGASELPQAFAAILASGADAIYLTPESTLGSALEVRKQIADWAKSHRMPTASTSSPFAADGGLVSLGPDFAAITRRSATYVHRILRGAKPAELPVERPTIFKLSVNRNTAKALGITIPQSLLLRADEVIE
jgi:putative tryptophan/tyrosine transport system substrate-binding protein